MAIGALLAAGGIALGQTVGNWLSNRQANKTNIQLAREGQEFEQKMWKQSNDYNSPERQMERLKAAGLNPNLVYGTGNVSGQSSSPSPKAHVATVKPVLEGMQPLNTMAMISQYQDIKTRQAQTDNIKANTELVEQKKVTEGMRPYLMQLEGAQKHLNYTQAQKIAPYQVALAGLNLKKIELANAQSTWQLNEMNPIQKAKAEQEMLKKSLEMRKSKLDMKLMNQKYEFGKEQISAIKLDQSIKDLEYQISKGLSPYGLQAKDNVFARQGARLLDAVKTVGKEPSKGRGIWKSKYYDPNLQY